MQRVDLPALVWRLSEPAATSATGAAPVVSALPNWHEGQMLVGQVVENLGGQVLVLIDGHRLRADWPGAPQVPGARVNLQVVGQAAGQWRLALLNHAQLGEVSRGALHAASLLELLTQLRWPLTYSNVERLARLVRGQPAAAETGATASAAASSELCPPNLDVWQQLCGFEPGLLAAAFFTWQPFTCGLFVEEKGEEHQAKQSEVSPLSFLFVVDLPRLGQIEVVGRGRWPEQSIVFVAQKETVTLLQKREAELIALLAETGMELSSLVLRATTKPLLNLLQPEMVPYRGLDRLL